MNNSVPGSPVQAVDRAVTVLEILARHGESGVSDIAAELDVHRSTAFRLVAALEMRGLVEQTVERGKYRLGVGILRLAGSTSARLDVVQEARPVGRLLAAETGETVNVAVLSEGWALYLDQIAGSSSLQSHNWVGQRIPLHATSNGKVLLSALSGEELRSTPAALTAYTDLTITTRAALRREIASVRKNGYATAVDEFEVGLTAMAAPIRDAHGDLIASLSVSGPTFRLAGERLGEVVPTVVQAAREVSHRLGWSDHAPYGAR